MFTTAKTIEAEHEIIRIVREGQDQSEPLQLGHARTAFTLDTYADVLPHMQDEAAARIEAMLLGQTP